MNALLQRLVAISGWKAFKASMKNRFAPEAVDGRQFNDPVALLVSWKPLDYSGLLFPRRLRYLSDGSCGFQVRRLFVLALLLLPLVIALALYKLWFVVPVWFAVSYSLVFMLLFLGSTPVRADKKSGWLHKGRGRQASRIPIADIYALQLLSFFYQTGRPGDAGVVYQLNLVRRDHRRDELVTQRQPPFRASREAIASDAKRFAAALGVPLWDAISEYDR